MGKERHNLPDVQIVELERMIDAFKEKFKERTSNADDFITIHEIEQMWGELQSNTLNIYSDMVRELLSKADERELIRKKKQGTHKKESNSALI